MLCHIVPGAWTQEPYQQFTSGASGLEGLTSAGSSGRGFSRFLPSGYDPSDPTDTGRTGWTPFDTPAGTPGILTPAGSPKQNIIAIGGTNTPPKKGAENYQRVATPVRNFLARHFEKNNRDENRSGPMPPPGFSGNHHSPIPHSLSSSSRVTKRTHQSQLSISSNISSTLPHPLSQSAHERSQNAVLPSVNTISAQLATCGEQDDCEIMSDPATSTGSGLHIHSHEHVDTETEPRIPQISRNIVEIGEGVFDTSVLLKN